jgi:glycosyltransferase involved in cell wall biosynthesis
MAACDIHLLLYECGGWELTVLETGACGVPNVVTDVAAPPEYAAPFSRLIPVATHVIGISGHRGLADLDAAAAALVELGESPEERARLGARGVVVAAAHDWNRVGQLWLELLEAGG